MEGLQVCSGGMGVVLSLSDVSLLVEAWDAGYQQSHTIVLKGWPEPYMAIVDNSGTSPTNDQSHI